MTEFSNKEMYDCLGGRKGTGLTNEMTQYGGVPLNTNHDYFIAQSPENSSFSRRQNYLPFSSKYKIPRTPPLTKRQGWNNIPPSGRIDANSSFSCFNWIYKQLFRAYLTLYKLLIWEDPGAHFKPYMDKLNRVSTTLKLLTIFLKNALNNFLSFLYLLGTLSNAISQLAQVLTT